MQQVRRARGVICFTNPGQFTYVRQSGIYGNVSSGDRPARGTPQGITRARITRFGKLTDLLCIATGDYVFLFEREKSRLHGVWRVYHEPFFCSSQVFDPSNDYPYRFYIQQYLNFEIPVPSMELRKLLNDGVLWSIRTFEREPGTPFASINPISVQETEALLQLFWKYNHRTDPTSSLISYGHQPLQDTVNFHDLVMGNTYSSSTPLEIKADNLGQFLQGQIYEEAIHCYLIYNLVRRTPSIVSLFGQYSQVLREVPISVAGQQRADILLIYHNAMTGEPTVYTLVEVKRSRVTQDMLRQLLEYVRLFSERHNLDLNSVEGVYIGAGIDPNALEYVKERAKVEVERPIRLFNYEVTGNTIKLKPVL